MFEYGTLLEASFRDEPRSIPSHAIVQYAHDALVLFARIYRLAGYEGHVAAVARLDGIAGYPLGVDPARVWRHHPIVDDTVKAQPWTGTVAALEEAGASAVARDLADRVFLAAGAGRPYFFDQQGQYTG